MFRRVIISLATLLVALSHCVHATADLRSFSSGAFQEPDSTAYELSVIAVDFLSRREYDSARHYFGQAISHNVSTDNKMRLAETYNNLGVLYFHTGGLDSSLLYYNKAYGLYSGLRDTARIVALEINLGIVYKEKGLYEKALAYLLAASRQLEKEEPSSQLASCYNTIGNLYMKIGELSSALTYHYNALEVRRKSGPVRGVASSYNNMGNVFLAMGLYDSALVNYERALTLRRSTADKGGEASSLHNIGDLMIKTGQVSRAVDLLRRALEIRMSTDEKVGQVASRASLAQAYLLQGKFDQADRELKVAEAMATSLELLEQLKNIYELKVALYKEKNDPAAALAYSEQLLVVKDSLLNREKAQTLAEMQTRYESLKKEDRIALLEKEGLLRTMQLERNQIWLRMLAVAIMLVLIIVGLVYYNFRVVRRNKKHIELLLRELHHRVKNNLQILSSLLSLQSQQLTDDTAIRAVKSSESRINAMALIHRKLYTVDQNRTVDIKEYITELIQYLVYSYGYHEKNFKLDLEIKEISIDVDKAIPLGLILNELISNAFKHAYAHQPNPSLAINLAFPDVHELNISIRDNGGGIPAGEEKQRKTFGMKIVHTLTKELKGRLNVRSDNGTTYELNIPL